MPDAVVCQGLSRAFGTLLAVDGLDLTVGEGEVFGLVGPDGAGKTTTIRMLTTILAPSSGAASVLGHDVVSDKQALRGTLGYMSQRFNLYGDLTVGENLRFYADLYGVPETDLSARMDELLGFSRLGPFIDRRAELLSGGMKQKLALACNLIHEPRILFLDEPTTGVDPVSRREFWRILGELNAEGATLVISTPYMDEAERCDRIAFLDSGRLMTVATPAEIRGRLTGSLLEVAAEPRRRARDVLRGLAGLEEVELYGDRVLARVEDAGEAQDAVREALERAGIQVESVRAVAPSMESAFVDLVRHGERVPER